MPLGESIDTEVVAAGFLDFGFFGSRLPRFCPFATVASCSVRNCLSIRELRVTIQAGVMEILRSRAPTIVGRQAHRSDAAGRWFLRSRSHPV
jgi:hypothetical protein